MIKNTQVRKTPRLPPSTWNIPLFSGKKCAERLGMLALHGYPTFFLVVWQRQFLGMLSYAYGVRASCAFVVRTFDWLKRGTWLTTSSQRRKRWIHGDYRNSVGASTATFGHVIRLQRLELQLWQSWCMKHDPRVQQAGLFTVWWGLLMGPKLYEQFVSLSHDNAQFQASTATSKCPTCLDCGSRLFFG